MTVSLATRSTAEISIQQVRAPLFVPLSDGSIRNGYTIKISNKERQERSFTLSIAGLPGAALSVVGRDTAADGSVTIAVPADKVGTFTAHIRVPEGKWSSPSTHFNLQATETITGEVAVNETVFSAPER
jgi:polyferredoxin